MSRNLSVSLVATTLLVASACRGEERTSAAAQPAPPAEAPAQPAPTASPTEPAAAEPPATAPTTSSAPDAGAPGVDPTTLVGHVGFDWLHPGSARCKKLDAATAKKLAARGARCVRRPAAEAFAENAGEWLSCKAGKIELLLYADQKICKEQLETMEANAP